jgi:hypothetical protein
MCVKKLAPPETLVFRLRFFKDLRSANFTDIIVVNRNPPEGLRL